MKYFENGDGATSIVTTFETSIQKDFLMLVSYIQAKKLAKTQVEQDKVRRGVQMSQSKYNKEFDEMLKQTYFRKV